MGRGAAESAGQARESNRRDVAANSAALADRFTLRPVEGGGLPSSATSEPSVYLHFFTGTSIGALTGFACLTQRRRGIDWLAEGVHGTR